MHQSTSGGGALLPHHFGVGLAVMYFANHKVHGMVKCLRLGAAAKDEQMWSSPSSCEALHALIHPQLRSGICPGNSF